MSTVIGKLVGKDGYKYSVIDGQLDATNQVQRVTQAINNGTANAVWLIPVAAQAMTPVIQQAKQAKIPIVLQAAPQDFGLKGAQPGIVFISPSFHDFGATIGKAALKCMQEKHLVGSDVLLLTNLDTTAGSKDIKAGAHDGLGSKVKITATVQAADVSTAQTEVSQLLIAHPNAKVVVALSNEDALGAIGAYKAAGKTPACLVVGGGNDPNVDAAQKAGKITTLVSFDSTGGIQEVWASLKTLLADPTAKGKVLSMPFKVTS
jgi:ABC-type sugar transport system substrate-binding protein